MSDETTLQHDHWQGARSESAGVVIGAYTLLRLIGEGGFGDVWEAEQSEPVKRRVALKIVKLGMDTREVIARFDLERQALARMEHPHIATVIDAGATSSGRPYFVMEYVDGQPISEYCASRKLPVDAVLGLFGQVCAAVGHAHTKGVIHRDLKPGNVLVGTHDGEAFAKVIDFGIAKATSGENREQTLATRIHQVVGTPLYMSPEQAIGSLDIDVRTDIYSLGVILYELLTGTTPVEREKLASVSIADTQRLICDTDPPRPSARVLANATTLTGSATFRPADPRKLARTIRGDLDWIVMKALEKEPARRYQSAAELADDLRRYLDGEAVSAVPPSWRYRSGKFVRRHKVPVLAAALVLAVLVVGIVAFAWQARIASQRAGELAQVTAFDAAIFEQIDPARAGARMRADVRARFAQSLRRAGLDAAQIEQREQRFDQDWQAVNTTDAAREVIEQSVLQPAVAAIDARFGKQPLLAAQMRVVLAKRYDDMGLYDAALPLEMAALATRRKLLGEADPQTAALEFGVGSLLYRKGEFAKAAPYYQAALKTALRRGGEYDKNTLVILGNLALVYADQGRFDLAEPYYRRVLEGRRKVLGEDDPATLLALQNLGSLLRTQGKYDQAEPYLRQAAAAQERVSGPNADFTLYAMGNLALLAVARGHYADAEREISEVLARARRTYGETYPTTLLASVILGGVLDREGKFAQAETLLASIGPAADKALVGGNAFWNGMRRWHLGHARAAQGRFAQAEPDLLAAQATLAQPHVAQEPHDLRDCTGALVDLYVAWDKAEPGKGYIAKAERWRAELAKIGAAGSAAVGSARAPADPKR